MLVSWTTRCNDDNHKTLNMLMLSVHPNTCHIMTTYVNFCAEYKTTHNSNDLGHELKCVFGITKGAHIMQLHLHVANSSSFIQIFPKFATHQK